HHRARARAEWSPLPPAYQKQGISFTSGSLQFSIGQVDDRRFAVFAERQSFLVLPYGNNREKSCEHRVEQDEIPKRPGSQSDLDPRRPVDPPVKSQSRLGERRYNDQKSLEPHSDHNQRRGGHTTLDSPQPFYGEYRRRYHKTTDHRRPKQRGIWSADLRTKYRHLLWSVAVPYGEILAEREVKPDEAHSEQQQPEIVEMYRSQISLQPKYFSDHRHREDQRSNARENRARDEVRTKHCRMP